jgi:hypothetical protein
VQAEAWDAETDALERRWQLGIYSHRASVPAMAGWAWMWLVLSLGAAWLFIWASFFLFSGLLAVLVAIPMATLPTLLATAASAEVIWRGMRGPRRHPVAIASACLSLLLAVAVPILVWSALS